jgi:hypothetical protein
MDLFPRLCFLPDLIPISSRSDFLLLYFQDGSGSSLFCFPFLVLTSKMDLVPVYFASLSWFSIFFLLPTNLGVYP